MNNVTIDRIAAIADTAAAEINKLDLGTTDSDHHKIKMIVAAAVAKAVAEQRAAWREDATTHGHVLPDEPGGTINEEMLAVLRKRGAEQG